MHCWVPHWTPERDYFVTRFQGLQGAGGHHVTTFISAYPRKPGTTFDCTSPGSMVSLSPLILPDPGSKPLLPEGFAVRLPKGSNIVIQSHYINQTERGSLVSDVARFSFFTRDQEPIVASYLILNDNELKLAPGVAQAGAQCELKTMHKLLALMGHMHGLGTRMSVERQRNGKIETIYKADRWSRRFRDLPPCRSFEASNPLQLAPKDSLRLRCHYNNNTGRIVRFPEEMCAMVAYYYPALSPMSGHPNGLVVCR